MKRGVLAVLMLILCTTVLAIEAPGIPFAPKHYICGRTTKPLYIDGNLSEHDWQAAPWTDAFMDIEGSLKPLPRFATRAKMLWDDSYFYVAAQMEEPHVWANLREHDSIIFYDNDFEVFIDPDGDTHNYYELEVNAFATAWDLFLDRPYRDNGTPLFYWDIRGLQKAVTVQGSINEPGDVDQGWTIELAIPWAVLKEQAPGGRAPMPGESWRVNFSRVEWRVETRDGQYAKVINPATGKPFPEDNWVWSPQGVINMHYPEMWGFVQFAAESAGQAADAFVLAEGERIKYLMRQIYYRQHQLKKERGAYTTEWNRLGLKLEPPAGYLWPPRLYVGATEFEAVLTARDGQSEWHIRQGGRVWRKTRGDETR